MLDPGNGSSFILEVDRNNHSFDNFYLWGQGILDGIRAGKGKIILLGWQTKA